MTQPDPNLEAAIQAGADALRSAAGPSLGITGRDGHTIAHLAPELVAKAVIDAAIQAGHIVPLPPRSYARKGWELYHEAHAEVERLRDAIRQHRDRWAAKGKATNWDHELWAVLDDEEAT
ncbi:MAG: hypothetical protein M3N32_07990 [Actinomycetota bacterium]|nr:hypothetical protein [Actinomycetota bacterium]